MEYLIFVLCILAFIVGIMVKGYFDDQKRKKEFIRKLYENYGSLPEEKDYLTQDYRRISRYFAEHSEDGFFIDDITWNDLNLDGIFSRINYTYSAAGEEYLYHLLRSPIQNDKGVSQIKEEIEYFMVHEDERVCFQTAFAQMGKTGKYSIYDYIKNLDILGERSNKMHYLGNAFLLVSLLVLFFSLQLGLLLLFIGISKNIVNYYKTKSEIEPYIISFEYILRLIRGTEELEKISCSAFDTIRKEIREDRKKFHKFRTGSYILMTPGRMSSSGNPLEIILDYVRMVFHLDLIKFNTMLAEVRNHVKEIDRMITGVGHMEAVMAVGAFRASLKTYCIPSFDNSKHLKAQGLYHPMINDPVKSNINTQRGILLTGSNASGKSTFLKTVAINAVLAQTIFTCMADSYESCMFRIMSSMALRDDLEGGDSYYMVEIKSLKRIMDSISREKGYLLCFVDEVLRGTNTVERIAASTQILRSLAGAETICFAATHDIELTHLLEELYSNYHFEEEIIEGDVVFNYRLMKGRATTRNAIRLLAMIGYDERIIQEADRLAASFLSDGKWK